MICELCGDRGWLVEPDGGNGAARRCSCYTGRPIETKLQDCGVGSDLFHASWETWQGKRPDIATFPNPDTCITLSGPTGNGKSHAAVAILRQWLAREYRCRFVEVPDMLEEIKTTFGTDESPEVLIRELQTPDLLVLDEAYAHHGTSWADATLSRIIRARLRDRKPMIITTNLTPEQLQTIEPRVASRLQGNLLIEFGGKDWRQSAKIGGVHACRSNGQSHGLDDHPRRNHGAGLPISGHAAKRSA